MTLNEKQDQKFRYACIEAIPENQGIGNFDLMATFHIYLTFIHNNLEIDLWSIDHRAIN